MTGKEQRILGWVIDDLARGDVPEGVRRLCELVRRPVPELRKRQPLRAERRPRGKAVTQAVGPQTRLTRKGRLKSEQAIAAYKAEHPACEIAGPDCDGPLDFSHLISRQRGGNDAADNGLVKCRFHHQAWHTVGRLQWLLTYGDRLTPETLEKVKRAFKVNATEQVERPVRVPGSHALQRS